MQNSLKTWRDSDIDLAPLLQTRVAIVGYGSQGRPHALNLRDSGVEVIVGQRPGAGFDLAVADGFEPVSIESAVKDCGLVAILLPDEIHKSVFESKIQPHLQPGSCLLTCHGFSFHYQQLIPPPGTGAVVVAPKGAGHRVRSAFTEGHGVACLVAAGPGAEEKDWLLGLAYAKALGGGRVGIMETTVGDETETDLFGEQTVLCGGLSHLVLAAFETLVDAGYPEELAYYECAHEVKLVADLLHRGGPAHMREQISNTAEFGDYSRGPRIINEASRKAMQEILAEIRSGKFAQELLDEQTTQRLAAWRAESQAHPIEEAAAKITRLENRPE